MVTIAFAAAGAGRKPGGIMAGFDIGPQAARRQRGRQSMRRLH